MASGITEVTEDVEDRTPRIVRIPGNTWHISPVPASCKGESTKRPPCCLGIDEAGRGPVMGPMTYGAAYWTLDNDEEICKLGYDDSKKISESERTRMFDGIKKESRIGWMVNVISAAEISGKMLQRTPKSLNAISHEAATALIQQALNDGVNLTEVYVDTVGIAENYERHLTNVFKNYGINFTVCAKADSLFKVVSAASICAKVMRDDINTAWRYETGPNPDMPHGSGYPSDPITKAWMAKNMHNVFGYPPYIRFSWAPARKAMEEGCAAVHWADELDEDARINQQNIVDMFGGSKAMSEVAAGRKKRKRCEYLSSLALEPLAAGSF